MQPTDLPARKAATGAFRRGQPKTVSVFGSTDDWRVRYLASDGPTDPVQALREMDARGRERLLAHPRDLLADDEDLPAAERARRERLREGGAGITAISSDDAGTRTVFALSGRLWLVESDTTVRALATTGGVVDPRISPDGSKVAYHSDGDLCLIDLAEGSQQVLAAAGADQESWGLAEFIAAEEMGRTRGFWWSPTGEQLLATHVDEGAVDLWWISDPAEPAAVPRQVRYPAAGTANAQVRLWLVDLGGDRVEVGWDRAALPYLAAVRWDDAGCVITVQSRDQTRVAHLALDPASGKCQVRTIVEHRPWVELVPGSPRLAPDGELVHVAVDPGTDAWRVRKGERWLTEPQWYIRALLRCDETGVWASGTTEPQDNHLLRIDENGVACLTGGPGWHTPLATGSVPVVAVTDPLHWQPQFRVGDPQRPAAMLPNAAEAPGGTPRAQFLPSSGAVRVAVILPPSTAAAPVIVSSYGGPHAQRVVASPLSLATEQWLADCGFAVVVVDGRGSPGVAPSCEAAIAADLAGPPLADQIEGLRAAVAAFPGRLDESRVGIRGWSFGGYLSALAVLREPEVFHAAFAGAPVTRWELYDTHYTERYIGDPTQDAAAYEASSLLPLAAGLRRPLCLVHGLADDNVVAAHTLQLSAALTAHGRPHEVLPLPRVSHMTPQESITEHLLRIERTFFARHLGLPSDEG
jgi:dipeptidyl-peptidase-4